MGDSTEDKTEKPTFKKYKEAHDSGKVARSRDLAVAIAALAVVIAMTRLGPALVAQLSSGLGNGLTRLGNTPTATITSVELSALVMSNGWILMLAVGSAPAGGRHRGAGSATSCSRRSSSPRSS